MQKRKPQRIEKFKNHPEEAASRPLKYSQFFNFDKLSDRRRYEIYRMYRAGNTPSAISMKLGFHEAAFCEQWQRTIFALVRIYESPIDVKATRGSPKEAPSQFNKRELNLIKLAIIAGRTHEEVAKLLDVSAVTLWEYRKRNPLIDEYMRSGYEEELLKVEAAIQRRAQGMITKEVKLASYMGRFMDEREVKVHHLPDPRSAELVLVNKRKWMSANVGGPDQSTERGRILEFIDQASSDEEQPSKS